MLKRQFLIVLLFSVFVTSCSNDGTLWSDNRIPINDDGPSTNPSANGDLKGEIWVASRFGSERFNLQTGEKTEVSEGEAYPSRDGSVYVEYIEDYSNELDPTCALIQYEDTHLVSIKDSRTGETKSSFLLNVDVVGPLRLSPDGERIAMYVSALRRGCGSNSDINDVKFAVYSKNGDELFRTKWDSLRKFDWHPDGRLVILQKWDYPNYEMQIETGDGTYKFHKLFDFTSSSDVGYFTGLRVSSKGYDAVLEAVTDQAHFLSGFSWRNATAHHFRLDQPLSETDLFEYSDESRVNTPIFSPDGEYILVTEGYSSGAHAFYTSYPDLGILASLDVIPVAGGSVSYVVPVLAPKEQLMPPLMYSETLRPVLSNRSGTLNTVGFDPITDLTWTPVVD